MSVSLAVEVVPTGTVGAEVKGVDIARASRSEVDAIKRAWYQHDVLVFRGQKLTDDDLLAFSRNFGTDASMLYSLEIPARGGDTWFCGMKAALAKMPRNLVERIKNLDIKHDGTYDSGGYVRKGMTASSDPRTSVGTPHPIVITHPVSGDKALYLGRRLNAYVVGLELAESERLLDEIWSCVEAAVYKHRWALGDLVLWDNRTTMHRRDAFDPKARRVMHRTQIKGSGAPARAAL